MLVPVIGNTRPTERGGFGWAFLRRAMLALAAAIISDAMAGLYSKDKVVKQTELNIYFIFHSTFGMGAHFQSSSL
jgi:hypothetical protein